MKKMMTLKILTGIAFHHRLSNLVSEKTYLPVYPGHAAWVARPAMGDVENSGHILEKSATDPASLICC